MSETKDWPATYVNDERTVLVTVWPNDNIAVARRDSPDRIWGPPIKVTNELEVLTA